MSITRKSLGRKNGHLGRLYNANTESIENLSIFKKEITDDLIKSIDIAKTKFEYTFDSSFNEKTRIIGIDGSLKLSILCGLMDNLDISGKFFNTKIENENSVNGSIIYETETKYESLEMNKIISDENVKDIISTDILETTDATHVITAIEWGGNAYANFEYANNDNKKDLEIKGDIKLIFKKVTTIRGQASGNYSEDEKKILNNLKLKFHGDLLIDERQLPNNLESFFNLIQDFPKYIKQNNSGKGVHLVYYLISIDELKKYLKFQRKIDSIIKELNRGLMHRVEEEINNFREQKNEFNFFFNFIKKYENYFDQKIIHEFVEKTSWIKQYEEEFYNLIKIGLVNARKGNLIELENILKREENLESNSGKSLRKFIRDRNYLREKITRIEEYKKKGIYYIENGKYPDILYEHNQVYVLFISKRLIKLNENIFYQLENYLFNLAKINNNNNNNNNDKIKYTVYDNDANEYLKLSCFNKDKNEWVQLFTNDKNFKNNIWMSGHYESVLSLTVLANGDFVSGAEDNTIKIWSINEKKEIKTLEGHLYWIWSLIVLPNGNLVSGSKDNTIKIWNIDEGKEIKTLKGHSDTVRALTVLPNGNLVSGSEDNSIKMWNIDEGKEIKTLKGHSDSVRALTVLPNGNLVSGSEDKSIKIWNIDEGKEIKILRGHTCSVLTLAVLPKGNLASGSADDTIIIWNIDDGNEIKKLDGDSGSVLALAFLPNGYLASGLEDNLIKIWNIDEGKEIKTLEGHSDSVRALTVLPNGNLVSASDDNTIRVWCLN